MSKNKVKVGVIGCGNISPIYLSNMCDVFEILEVVACADIIHERAEKAASEHAGVEAMSVKDLLAIDDLDIVVNLTVPKAHAEVTLAALAAGKNAHTEKPLAITREDGRKILDTAAAADLLVSCAPDTFLGGGIQTCRKLIDDGWIGEPIGAAAFMMGMGPESWHPNPEIFYQEGAGPLFDVGVYYVTTLISLLGPIKRVAGATKIPFPERLITSQPLFGQKIKVEVPTYVSGVLDFAGGAVGTLIASFDIRGSHVPRIEIYGTEGALSVPDPNTFGGTPRVIREGGQWTDIPLSHGYSENGRGLGVTDMAYALRSGRPHRASGALGYHVLDVMHAFYDSSDTGKHVEVESTCERPAPFPLGLRNGILDE